MDEDIQSQLDRAKELLQELETACDNELQAKNVSGKTKNLSQEVLTKIKHLLDQVIYKFFEKYYLQEFCIPRSFWPALTRPPRLRRVETGVRRGRLVQNPDSGVVTPLLPRMTEVAVKIR